MAAEQTGKIAEWDRSKGYGYVKAGPKRYFLHRRDFAEHHKAPAVGDRIHFQAGADDKGRPCAVKAVHVNDGGRFGIGHSLLLGLLLALPFVAWCCVHPLVQIGIGAAYGISSLAAWFAYVIDKQRARANGASGTQHPRVPETSLHLIELLGGWPAAFIAQRKLRHKCAKARYQVVYWAIVGGHQLLALDFLCDWRLARMILG
ncbi:DUF1294 domain-containing protein [Luteolibacter sp. LG18]|uniref:DUF1294 domain-containing protein n=1 Tax=Luteolibacter sp. LG18 TaxID=2819286 RepID=UPI0030C736F0